MQPAIEIRNLGKQYTIAPAQPYVALRDVISDSVKNLLRTRGEKKKFWALKDISLDIMPGERVGIIGRNGAGKSTLLKIISRITPPTRGDAWINGRVGSLLEVGTGFHPELTGRENIYLNGSILGLKKTEIGRQLDAIIDFSGVEQFIDTPLKHYSSGMQMRLAFSVAAHLQSEILLIDEVLAVGDIEFQKKCLGKMEEVSSKEGRTVLFVSHDLTAVNNLTSKCLLLQDGLMTSYDSTRKIINEYAGLLLQNKVYRGDAVAGIPSLTRVELFTSEGNGLQAHGKEMSIEFEIDMPGENIPNTALSFQVFNRLNQAILYNWRFDQETMIARKKGKNILRFTYDSLPLFKGDYYLKVHLAETKGRNKFMEIECCPFSVEMINMKEPEWGWNEGVCQVLEQGSWEER